MLVLPTAVVLYCIGNSTVGPVEESGVIVPLIEGRPGESEWATWQSLPLGADRASWPCSRV